MEKPLRLGTPHPPRDSHFPTAATTNFRLHFQCLDNLSYGYILKWLDRARTALIDRAHPVGQDTGLIAQARLEGLTLLTADTIFRKYEVEQIFCGK